VLNRVGHEMHHKLYDVLSGVVGPENVVDEDYALFAHVAFGGCEILSLPESDLTGLPEIVVKPQTTMQISRILKIANRTRTPVHVRGGGEGVGSTPMHGGILLCIEDNMNEIINIDKENYTVTVQAGCTWTKLNYELRKHGLRTGFMGPHGCCAATIAGSIASNSIGICGSKYGLAGSAVTALEVVLPTSDIIRTGSRTNINADKLGVGYYRYCNGPDSTGLFIGSQGIFGLITEVTYEVINLPTVRMFESYYYKDLADGVKATQKQALTGFPEDMMLSCGRHSSINIAPEAPQDIEAFAALEIAGYDEDAVAWQKDEVDRIAKEQGGTILGPEPAERCTFDAGGTQWPPSYALGTYLGPDIIIPPSAVPKLTEVYEDFFRKNEDLMAVKGAYSFTEFPLDRRVCSFHPAMMIDQSKRDVRKRAMKLFHEMQEIKNAYGGTSFYVGPGEMQHTVKWWIPEYHHFLRALKQALDPNNVLNPGLFML